MSKIARYYDASKNPDQAALGGVPLDDLTVDQYEALAPHQQASVDALPFYRKTKPEPHGPTHDVAAAKPQPAPQPAPAPTAPAPTPAPARPAPTPPAADTGGKE